MRQERYSAPRPQTVEQGGSSLRIPRWTTQGPGRHARTRARVAGWHRKNVGSRGLGVRRRERGDVGRDPGRHRGDVLELPGPRSSRPPASSRGITRRQPLLILEVAVHRCDRSPRPRRATARMVSPSAQVAHRERWRTRDTAADDPLAVSAAAVAEVVVSRRGAATAGCSRSRAGFVRRRQARRADQRRRGGRLRPCRTDARSGPGGTAHLSHLNRCGRRGSAPPFSAMPGIVGAHGAHDLGADEAGQWRSRRIPIGRIDGSDRVAARTPAFAAE